MMYLDPGPFLKDQENAPIIDVRSPAEYEKGHISGAISVPLFTDKERAIVGTLYAEQGQEAAIKAGFELATPKTENLSKLANQIARDGKLRVHCWRGGMRSEKMAQLFESTGLHCVVLRGGYKSFRQMQREDYGKINNLCLLEGPTGSGKTEILQEMRALGGQVVDLEALANHRGSTFGWVGMEKQPSTAQFQNEIYAQLLSLDNTKPIWMEGESLKIGRVTLPESLWDSMNNANIFRIDINEKLRAGRIIDEYGKYPTEELISSLNKIESRLGSQDHGLAEGAIKNNDLSVAVEILLRYYDKLYQYSMNKNRSKKPNNIMLKTGDPKINAKIVLDKIQESKNER